MVLHAVGRLCVPARYDIRGRACCGAAAAGAASAFHQHPIADPICTLKIAKERRFVVEKNGTFSSSLCLKPGARVDAGGKSGRLLPYTSQPLTPFKIAKMAKYYCSTK